MSTFDITPIYRSPMTAYLCHKEIGQNSVPTQQLSAKGNHLAGHPGVPSLKCEHSQE
jgi:hypothetical protein